MRRPAKTLRGGVTRALAPGPGYLLIATGDDLQAATFDERTLTLTGGARLDAGVDHRSAPASRRSRRAERHAGSDSDAAPRRACRGPIAQTRTPAPSRG